MKEKQENLRILKQLKDFDERKNQEVAARAYQEQEILKIKVIMKTIKMSSFDLVLQYNTLIKYKKRIRRSFVFNLLTVPERPFVLRHHPITLVYSLLVYVLHLLTLFSHFI